VPKSARVLLVAIALGVAVSSMAAEPDGVALRAPPGSSSAATEPLLASIEEEEARSGPFSPKLIELYATLALAYQENGDDAFAVPVFEHALYLMRVNDGLFRLDQAPLLQRLIDSELANGRFAAVAELRARLLELARRNLDDLRSVGILRAEAERLVAVYEGRVRPDIPPAAFTAIVSSAGAGSVGPRRAGPALPIVQAQMNYMTAIGAIMRSGEYDHPELAELENGLVRAYYAQASKLRRWSTESVLLSPDFIDQFSPTTQMQSLYERGRDSYRRRVRSRATAELSPLDRAHVLVEAADWSLLFSRNGTALERYAEAYALLIEQRVPEAAIRELFPTDTPVFLPAFSPSPFIPDATAANEYVDVDFEIGKYGTPRKVEIVAVAGEAAKTRSKGVFRAVSSARYRPRPLTAEEAATAYRVRYSLADGSVTPRP
jgi:hypothetical protein